MRTRHDPELYDDDLEWFVNGYDREMGRSGTLSATIAALEHGGHVSAGADTIEAMIERLARSVPAVARARRVVRRWSRLSTATRDILLAHYGSLGELPARSDALLGEFAKVALALASREADELRRVLRALARGDSGFLAPRRRAAERAVRAAHKAWSATAQKEAEAWAN
jgi:hypothetical protein